MTRTPLLIAVACSGAGALMFETLWLRSAAWLVGSSAVAAATVLAAMMAGLAWGGWLAARTAHAARDPARRYAAVELLAAAGGLGVVLGLPVLVPLAAPTLATLGQHPAVLTLLRLLLTFGLLALPAAAMGYTLPLITRAWADDPSLGRVLGRLYALNTAGAVAGTLATAFWLVPTLGVRGTAFVAAGLLVVAAACALSARSPNAQAAPRSSQAVSAEWLLLAAVAGGLALAAEVLWLRTLALQIAGTAEAFAGVLAWALAGLALGGIVGMRLAPRANSALPWLALAGGASLIVGVAVARAGWLLPGDGWRLFAIGGVGVAPMFVCSGALFTLLAQCAGRGQQHAAAAGAVSMANLLGSAAGAWLCGLWLLPAVGLSNAWMVVVVGYCGLAAALTLRFRAGTFAWAGSAMLVLASGVMLPTIQSQLAAARAPWITIDDAQLAAVRHGRVETAQLLRQDLAGQPLAWRLLTNRYSMSSTAADSRRYMAAFAWWPLALAEQPRDALLISYGLGTTAAALLSSDQIERLDLVDISPQTLALSRPVRASETLGDPLADPRSRAYIEDGRFWLSSQPRQYDIITGEPPPPRLAGIVNLYTAEYFAQMRQRLRPGGAASYWLPVDQLTPQSAKAITAGFCAAFEHCLLAAGSNYNWILIGLTAAPHIDDTLDALWQQPRSQYALRTSGFDQPGNLLASLIADDAALRTWADAPPLRDNFPGRLQAGGAGTSALQAYTRWAQASAADARDSDWIPPMRKRATDRAADLQLLLNGDLPAPQPELASLALSSGQISAYLQAMGSSWQAQQIVATSDSAAPDIAFHRGIGLLAAGNDEAALDNLLIALRDDVRGARAGAVLAACSLGRGEQAAAILGLPGQVMDCGQERHNPSP